jgi:hypothetical protein
MKVHCRNMAARIRSENGVEKAARLIEDYFEEKPRTVESS